MTVTKQVNSISSLFQISAGLPDHIFDRTLQDRRPSGDAADKWEIFDPFFPAQPADGIKESRAHQEFASAGSCHAGAGKAFFFRIFHYFETGKLAALSHIGKEFLHLIERKRDLFESPVLCLCIFALLKDLSGVLYSKIRVSQHDNQFRNVSHPADSFHIDNYQSLTHFDALLYH